MTTATQSLKSDRSMAQLSETTTLPFHARERATSALDETQRQLVEDHLSLVTKIGRRWKARCRSHVDHADLIQIGTMGLIDAARRFDAARCASFGAFAQERIHGAICDAFRQMDPLSRGRRKNVRRLEAAKAQLASRHGRAAEAAEVARMLGWTIAGLAEAEDDLRSLGGGWAQTLEVPIETEAADDVGSHGSIDALERLCQVQSVSQLVTFLGELSERQRQVLALYYHEELTMKEIGEVLDVTESRISQIHGAAIATLRALMVDSGETRPLAKAS